MKGNEEIKKSLKEAMEANGYNGFVTLLGTDSEVIDVIPHNQLDKIKFEEAEFNYNPFTGIIVKEIG